MEAQSRIAGGVQSQALRQQPFGLVPPTEPKQCVRGGASKPGALEASEPRPIGDLDPLEPDRRGLFISVRPGEHERQVVQRLDEVFRWTLPLAETNGLPKMVEPLLELAKANEIDTEEVVDLHLEWGGTDSASDHKSVMTEPEQFPVTPDQHEERRPRGQDAGTFEGWFARQHALGIAQRLEGGLVVSDRR